MEDFPSNSRSKKVVDDKQEVKKALAPLAVGATTKKKGLGRRFAETFKRDDTITVREYLFFDVLIPGVKDTFADVIISATERTLGTDMGASRRRSSGDRRDRHESYDRYSKQRPRERDRDERPARRRRGPHHLDDIFVNTRREAEDVIDMMYELLQKYEVVTVAELLSLVDITPEFTDDRWGWTDLRGLTARRVRDRYLIDIGKPEELDA